MVVLSGNDLSIVDVEDIAARRATVVLDPQAIGRVEVAHQRVQDWGAKGYPMYGVNTGFGETVHMAVPPRFAEALQVNLLRGHAAGAGAYLCEEVSRAIMSARLNCFLKGHSGVSAATVTLLAELLNQGIHPLIPEQGSLGASGDLAPLSHLALVLCGDGEAIVDGCRVEGAAALARRGLRPVRLGYKEGLALINGTSAMTGVAAIALGRARRLLDTAVFLSGVLIQALGGSTRAFEERGHELKGHRGQMAVAAALRELLSDSKRVTHHVELMAEMANRRGDLPEVVDTGVMIQNAYTLRCIPQILGPVLDTFEFCGDIVQRELNSCNDNPLIFESAEESFHGGNFHGQYVAMAADYIAVALTEIGVLAERQIDRILSPHLNGSLPDFLVRGDSGLGCGLMGAQYRATSIASENLDLATPSSIKSIPSNGGNQDVVSMGLNAARRCLRLCDNVENILMVLGAACFQAVSILGHEELSPTCADWFAALADRTGPFDDDQPVGRFLDLIKAAHRGGEPAGVIVSSVRLPVPAGGREQAA